MGSRRPRPAGGYPAATAPPRRLLQDRGRLRVTGWKDGRTVHLGTVDTPAEAEAMRQAALRDGTISVRGADGVDVTSPAFARFMGYWLGDGWITRNTICICGARDDGPMLVRLAQEAGLKVTQFTVERTGARVRCGSIELSAWITSHFGKGAANKTIPAWLHGAPDDYRNAFLEGYMRADGHTEQPAHGAMVYRFTTISHALSIGVRVLLNQRRLSCSITRHAAERDNVIEGRAVNETPFYRITTYGHARSFGFTDIHGWGLVRSVEPSLVRRVYNIAVAEDESYTADGIVVHNCQPFSAAGQGLGVDDPRHLWPDFFRLIRSFRPACIVGEQVAGAPGYGWFDGVRADLEDEGFAARTVDIPACSVDAPHVRQRLYWAATLGLPAGEFTASPPLVPRAVAATRFDPRPLGHRLGARLEGHAGHGDGDGRRAQAHRPVAPADGSLRERLALVDAQGLGRAEGRTEHAVRGGRAAAADADVPGDLADADIALGRLADVEPAGQFPHDEQDAGIALRPGPGDVPIPNHTFWTDSQWLVCSDGKARRAQPRIRFLVDGLRGRVDLWRIGGNAIVLPLATEVLKALKDVVGTNALTARMRIEEEEEIAA